MCLRSVAALPGFGQLPGVSLASPVASCRARMVSQVVGVGLRGVSRQIGVARLGVAADSRSCRGSCPGGSTIDPATCSGINPTGKPGDGNPLT